MRTSKNEARAGNNSEEVVGYNENAMANSTHAPRIGFRRCGNEVRAAAALSALKMPSPSETAWHCPHKYDWEIVLLAEDGVDGPSGNNSRAVVLRGQKPRAFAESRMIISNETADWHHFSDRVPLQSV
jgi:hypothetical protein